MATTDTIFALATPPGRSGVAVLRVSGRSARQALTAIAPSLNPTQRIAHYVSLFHPERKDLIDEALALWFPGPHSYTGEDIVEFHVHGSKAVIAELMDVLSGLPYMRMAEAGEFTRRAFLNGKMDLTEAEGVADLINAETRMQRQQALQILRGGQREFYDALRKDIIAIQALIEAYIDFPDEDIPESVLQEAKSKIDGLILAIENALSEGDYHRHIREGFYITLFGAPNAGKSSLINRLVNRDVAIVSSQPGTTRDVIEAHVNLDGYAVTFADTAGLRQTGADSIEAEGMRRTIARASDADLKIALIDGTDPINSWDAIRSHVDEHTLIVINKADLPIPSTSLLPPGSISISALSGQGVDVLLATISKRLGQMNAPDSAPLVTRERHKAALKNALNPLRRFAIGGPLELQAEELRLAAQRIGEITGSIQVDDILDVIFRSFCIGK